MRIANIAKAFFKLSPKYNIDPMMAISQSILETGWFKYQGSAVTVNQHNYCGLGVTSNGTKGGTFDTIEDGVTAQLQHLFAYGCKEAIPTEDKILDPRFMLVTRGIAPYWQQLAGRWACPGYDKKLYTTPQEAMEAGNTYGQKILAIKKTLLEISVSKADLAKYFPAEDKDTNITENSLNVSQTTESDKALDIESTEFSENTTSLLTELILKSVKNLLKYLQKYLTKENK